MEGCDKCGQCDSGVCEKCKIELLTLRWGARPRGDSPGSYCEVHDKMTVFDPSNPVLGFRCPCCVYEHEHEHEQESVDNNTRRQDSSVSVSGGGSVHKLCEKADTEDECVQEEKKTKENFCFKHGEWRLLQYGHPNFFLFTSPYYCPRCSEEERKKEEDRNIEAISAFLKKFEDSLPPLSGGIDTCIHLINAILNDSLLVVRINRYNAIEHIEDNNLLFKEIIKSINSHIQAVLDKVTVPVVISKKEIQSAEAKSESMVEPKASSNSNSCTSASGGGVATVGAGGSVPKPDYTPENSIPYSALKKGKKYSFTIGFKEMEGILISKKKSSTTIQFKITKDPGYNKTYSSEMSYTRTYLNNVKLVGDKLHGFDRDDLVDNSDDNHENNDDYDYDN